MTEKIFNVYDVPVLFVEILLKKPWLHGDKQYKTGQWIKWDGESLTKPEAQVRANCKFVPVKIDVGLC